MGVTVDTSELDRLAVDLGSAPGRVMPAVLATTTKAAVNVKNDLRAEASGVKRAPALPASINYELTQRVDVVEAQIGPREGGAGSLALLYYGNSRTGPRLPDPMGALEREGVKWVEFLSQIVADAVLP